MNYSKTNQTNVAILAALTASLFFILLNSGAPTPLYPLYMTVFSLSNTELTFIFSSYGFGVLLALFLSRRFRVSDKNAKTFLIGSLIVVIAPTLCFSFADSLYALCAFRFASGLGAGMAITVINTLLIKFSHGDGGNHAALLGSLALVTGLALGPVISSIYSQLEFYPLASPTVTVAALVFLSAIAIQIFWPKNASSNVKTNGAIATNNGAGFSKFVFYLLALCVFISWSYAALILSLGPAIAIDVLGLRSPTYFGYIASGYLLVAGIVQLTLSRFIKPEFSLILGLLTQIFSISIMTIALKCSSLESAAIGLALSGFSYGAVFVGSAVLVNKLSLAAPDWNAVSKFYFIVYLFNVTPLAAGWLTDKVGLHSALLVSLSLFLVIYVVLLMLTIFTLLLRNE